MNINGLPLNLEDSRQLAAFSTLVKGSFLGKEVSLILGLSGSSSDLIPIGLKILNTANLDMSKATQALQELGLRNFKVIKNGDSIEVVESSPIHSLQNAINRCALLPKPVSGNFSIEIEGLFPKLLEAGLKQDLVMDNEPFKLKEKLHVTIAAKSMGLLAHLKAKGSQDPEKEATDLFEQILDEMKQSSQQFKIKLAPKLHKLDATVKFKLPTGEEKSSHRKTIIIETECVGIKEFWAKLKEKTGQNFTEPPYHITLYARNLNDQDESKIGIAVIKPSQLDSTSPDNIATFLPDWETIFGIGS